jgi:DNA-binding transcriptional LysR family regulator
MDIKNIAVFHAAATGGSLAHAARQLDMTPMAVSRRLAALEQDLGVRLLHRTTRSISLTPEGEEFLPFARTMLDASDEAISVLQPSATGAKGILRITAPAAFGRIAVMPIIPALLEANPELRVDLQLTDAMVDIAASGIDVAIRIAPLKESADIMRGSRIPQSHGLSPKVGRPGQPCGHQTDEYASMAVRHGWATAMGAPRRTVRV